MHLHLRKRSIEKLPIFRVREVPDGFQDFQSEVLLLVRLATVESGPRRRFRQSSGRWCSARPILVHAHCTRCTVWIARPDPTHLFFFGGSFSALSAPPTVRVGLFKASFRDLHNYQTYLLIFINLLKFYSAEFSRFSQFFLQFRHIIIFRSFIDSCRKFRAHG